MSSISASDIVQQIRRRFGNRGSTDLDFIEAVQPTANLGDLDTPPFHGKGGFIAGINQIAVAAQYAYATAFLDANVAAQSARTVIRRLFLSANGAAQIVQIGIMNDPNLAGSGVKAALTSSSTIVRSWDSVPAMVAGDQLVAATRLAFGTSVTQVNLSNPLVVIIPTNACIVIEGPWSLAPGNHLVVMGNAVNQPLVASFYGDEYLIG